MTRYKCLIVDDEEWARGLIESHLSQLVDFELVASCSSAIEASRFLKENTVDLLFLDIEMPVLKGTDFFKNLVQKPSVIFTTAHRNYALDGFELDAVDYLLKPITFDRFFKATEKFLSQHQPQKVVANQPISPKISNPSIFIRKDRKQVKVFLEDINYIESLKDYVQIHLAKEKHTVKYSLSNFYELLDQRFLRIHRSFIVNMNKITAYTKHDVEIGVLEIPIGESYRGVVGEYLGKT